jgi:2-iminoacetate synthase
MNFYDELKLFSWNEVEEKIRNSSKDAVRASLAARSLGPGELFALLSPVAEEYLEEMAQRAQALTEQRFGRVINFFAPLYLSNESTNSCAYCGFNVGNRVQRLTLTVEQAEKEAKWIQGLGFRHLLLVSGEAPHIVSMEYLRQVTARLRSLFASISVEIYPLETSSYQQLVSYGVDGLVVFQETYDEGRYREVHRAGRKRDFRWRLEAPDRGGQAGFRRLGLGSLLGLNNWRVEGFFLGIHARYLMRRYWKSHVSISFPRLRPAAGEFEPPSPVSDKHLVQLITALRLYLPDAGLVLSTRESASLRDHLIPLGITSMSAGSHTEPGGYTQETGAEAQFSIADNRPPEVVASMIRQMGYDVVWKDWDAEFLRD